MAQTPEALERALSQHPSIANVLLGARDLFLEGLQAELATQPVNPACPKLHQYLMASMGSLPDEVLRILFLDASHRLIADEQLHHGSVRQLELYPRTIFRRAIEHGAVGLILVHNHPSGDVSPSESDIVVTQRLSSLGRSLDIAIVDHIVVTATRACRVAVVEPTPPTRSSACAHVLRDNSGSGDGPRRQGPSTALENARRAYRRRQFRRELIESPTLFGEPTWDMLIDLFIHESEGKKVATSALCIASTAPQSTALRLVNKLCEAKLLVKIQDPADGRRQFVELTPDTAARLEAYFSADEGEMREG